MPSSNKVLETLKDLWPPGTPVTTSEVAEKFDCPQSTIHTKLESLVDDGVLRMKQVGANGHVWWRPVESAQDRRDDSLQGHPQVRSQPLFNSEMVGVIVWGEDITIRDANDAFLEMVGLDYEEALGTSWEDLTPEEFYPASERHISEVEATGKGVPYEKQYYHADGSRWWGFFESQWLNDSEIVEFVVDITDRKEREQELERMRDLFKEAERLGDLGAWELDEYGDVSWTAGAKRIHGLDQNQDMTLEKAFEFVHPDDRNDLREIVDESFETGDTYEAETRIVTAQGEQRWVYVSGNPVESEGDGPTFRGFIQDITDRRERQRELRRKETVFENTQDAIFLIKVVDESEFRGVRVNPAYTDATGLTNEDIQGKTPREILDPEQGRQVETQYRECLERNEPVAYEETLTIDGEKRFWETTLAPVEQDGTVEYLVGATRDVTEKQERIQELSELHEAVETMLENVPLVFFTFDEEGIFTRSRGSALDRLGLESGEAVGMSVFDLFGAHPEIPGYCERALDGERVTATVEAGDGIFEAWFQPLYDDGDVTGVVGIGYDATERQERQRELLRKSRAVEMPQSVSR